MVITESVAKTDKGELSDVINSDNDFRIEGGVLTQGRVEYNGQIFNLRKVSDKGIEIQNGDPKLKRTIDLNRSEYSPEVVIDRLVRESGKVSFLYDTYQNEIDPRAVEAICFPKQTLMDHRSFY